MRSSTSILTLLLALGIYSAGSIVTHSGPFAATVAMADEGEGGGGGHGGSGRSENSGHDGSGSGSENSGRNHDEDENEVEDENENENEHADGEVHHGGDDASGCHHLKCALGL
jgi:hypothetical protein